MMKNDELWRNIFTKEKQNLERHLKQIEAFNKIIVIFIMVLIILYVGMLYLTFKTIKDRFIFSVLGSLFIFLFIIPIRWSQNTEKEIKKMLDECNEHLDALDK